MSILIRGMEMPTDHPMWIVVHSDGTVEANEVSASRPVGWQTLRNAAIPVPTPHGDLIDRNKLYKKTAEWEAQALHMVVTMHDEVPEWKRWSAVLTERSAFKFDVADAPTVIEAEEDV